MLCGGVSLRSTPPKTADRGEVERATFAAAPDGRRADHPGAGLRRRQRRWFVRGRRDARGPQPAEPRWRANGRLGRRPRLVRAGPTVDDRDGRPGPRRRCDPPHDPRRSPSRRRGPPRASRRLDPGGHEGFTRQGQQGGSLLVEQLGLGRRRARPRAFASGLHGTVARGGRSTARAHR